jgi:hypothetical protein
MNFPLAGKAGNRSMKETLMTTIRPGLFLRMQRSFAERGWLSTVRHYLIVFWNNVREFTPAGWRRSRQQRELDEEFIRKIAEIDANFDAKYGVDTSLISKDEWSNHSFVGKFASDGYVYHGVRPNQFRSAVESLGITPAEWTFVDIGAGKGRPLMMAQMFGFKRSIGVEYSRELTTICAKNLYIMSQRHSELPPAEILCQDALEYTIPDGPLIIYFYNPFGSDLMSRMAVRIHESLRVNPRPFYIIYCHPTCDETLMSSIPGLRRIFSGENFITYDWKPVESSDYSFSQKIHPALCRNS